MGVMALDIAGRTGWAYGAPGAEPVYGAQEIRHPGGPGATMVHYDTWLRFMIHTHDPRYVYAEAAFVGRFISAAERLFGYKALTRYRCHIEDRRLVFVPPREITKHFVGPYRGDKKLATIARCLERGWDVGGDDDAADALALWDFACKKILAKGLSQAH
jgi:hypothetical protein